MFQPTSIGMAGTLVVLAIGLSWVKHLELAKDLSVAAVRAFVQLMAVGFLLDTILRIPV
jgi:ABC-type iron transport system FetAB permease component